MSLGTERTLNELASKSLLGKARARPDELRRVLRKVRRDGLMEAVQAVKTRLQTPMTMGYASAGIVVACGDSVDSFRPGDRVASNGPHAGIVSVAKHLCARVPDNVPLDHAAFTVLGSIALHGVRLSSTQLGETVLVIGLGLVGQLAVGLLRTAGCRVVGTDPDSWKCKLAESMGAELARPGIGAEELKSLTGGIGADAVLVAASTESSEPMGLAARAVRRKGRVVLIGAAGLNLDRRELYHKEAELVVSCSYGPGRYDQAYEESGHDYPVGYVRWTEQRNFEAVLGCMASGSLDVAPLISHRFDIDRSPQAYAMIRAGREPCLGVVFDYPQLDTEGRATSVELGTARPRRSLATSATVGVGVLGAGDFARSVLLPEIAKCRELTPITLCSSGGTTAKVAGEKHGFHNATTDEHDVFEDARVDAVFIATRHCLHSRQVIEALSCGKHVFVEKPLCLTESELCEIEATYDRAGVAAPVLTVGFNRRFSPAARQVRSFFADALGPITVSIRFNAGAIAAEHWTQIPEVGGGRLLGEACHAIDLATFLVGSPPVRVHAESIGGACSPAITDDQCFITIRHANGSVSSIGYLAGGDTAFPKERVEVIGAGRVAVIDDFCRVTTVRDGRTKTSRMRKDKGHRACVGAFRDAIVGSGVAPIPFPELRAITLATILAARSRRERVAFDVR